MPTKRPPGTPRERLLHLIALDASLVVKRVGVRREEMIAVFAHRRERAALVDPLRSRVPSAVLGELLLLTIDELGAVSRFYETLDDLRWYLTNTVDMPGTLRTVFDAHYRGLVEAHMALEKALIPRVIVKKAPPRKEPTRQPQPAPRRSTRTKR